MPKDTYFKLFPVLVTTTPAACSVKTDYIATNDITQNDTKAAEEQSSIRWQVEQLHREEKQLTGIQKCQCRIATCQRNHLAIAMLVWNRLKVFAYQAQQSVYAIKRGLLAEYMVNQLKNPTHKFAYVLFYKKIIADHEIFFLQLSLFFVSFCACVFVFTNPTQIRYHTQ
jgi:hypothetical protein